MVSIFCTVTKGDFPLEVQWALEGRNVDEIPGISVMRTNKRISQLSIDSVQAHHAGEYVCSARNTAGNVSLSTVLHVNGITIVHFFLTLISSSLTLIRSDRSKIRAYSFRTYSVFSTLSLLR